MATPKQAQHRRTDGSADSEVRGLVTRLDRALALLELEVSAARRQHGTAAPREGAPSPLEAVLRAIDDLAREHTKLIHQAQQELANADEWERRAKLCVTAGDDELATLALAHRKWHLELEADRIRDASVLEKTLQTYRSFEAELERLPPDKR